jgi:hypothetical protein
MSDHAREKNELVTTLQAEQEASGWQPIETAPKEHDNMLLSDGVAVSQGGWLTQTDQGAEYEGQCGAPSPGWWSVDSIEHPTHWMPLPSPPRQAEREAGRQTISRASQPWDVRHDRISAKFPA